jgi:hypothetical protein
MEGVRRGDRKREPRQQLQIAIQPRAGAELIFGSDPQDERQKAGNLPDIYLNHPR